MLDDLLDLDIPDEAAGGTTTIGIDLGTTNSVVACVQGGEAVVFALDDGTRLHPSVVSFLPNGTHVVGEAARQRRMIDPENTVFSAKRIIGQSFRSADVQDAIRHLPYRVEEGDNEEPLICTRHGRDPVPVITALVLEHIKEIAAKRLGTTVEHCVITVPANFSDAQREATRQSAERAGLEVLRVLNEPTAAALAYGADQTLHQRIAVFDFGGGTFDLTLLAVREDIYEVVATGGDPYLGGDDLDEAIADLLGEQFLREHGIDPRTDPTGAAKLRLAAEQVKTRLSESDQVQGTLDKLAYGPAGEPLGMTFKITRAALDMLAEPIVDRTIECSRRVLEDAGVAPGQVDDVLLVGGSSRLPIVRRRVAELFGKAPRLAENPMQIVAVGAALQGHALFAPPEQTVKTGVGLLMDVTSHSLGVATVGGYAEPIIPKNTTIPAEGKREFSTARPDQTEVTIRVSQGEARKFADNVAVGELRLDKLEPKPGKRARVEVTFLIDADGILQVTARDADSNRAARVTLRRVGVSESSSGRELA